MAEKYKTPQGLMQAVKAAAKASGRDVNKAIAGFYHDRFLCRVFSGETPSFVLKGGQCLLAKLVNVRETRDIDLVGCGFDLAKALDDLREKATIDLGDFVEFRFDDFEPLDVSQDYREGYHVTFKIWVGETKSAGSLSVDLVVDSLPNDEFELIEPLSRLNLKRLQTSKYAVSVPEKRIAEKICAILQTYEGFTSSRVKDLVDLTTMMLGESIESEKLRRFLDLECSRRNLKKLSSFEIPQDWRAMRSDTYQKLASESNLPSKYRDIETAEHAVNEWLKPVFAGDGNLRWNPKDQIWQSYVR